MKEARIGFLGYAVSDVGRMRQNNEDNFLLGHCLNDSGQDHACSRFSQGADDWTCAAVFDGMGGVAGGEIASRLAAGVFQEAFLEDFRERTEEQISDVVRQCFRTANRRILAERASREVCGTTCSVVLANDRKLRAFHIGDSRIYLLREGGLFRLSKDQTLAQMKLDLGIYRSEAEVPERDTHRLMEYIGAEEDSERISPLVGDWIPWEDGDRILICSDGLYDMCEDEELLATLKKGTTPEEAAEELLRSALESGGKDNVTILILERKRI